MSKALRFRGWYDYWRSANLPDGLLPQDAEVRLNEFYDLGNRWMTRFVWGHFLIALLLMPIYETYTVSLIVAVSALGLFLIPRYFTPYAFLTRVSAGISLQAFVALSIYQLGGLPEMHFFFFTAVTMMLIYMDGRAILPGVFLIISQHILMAILEVSGVPDLSYWETTGDARFFAQKLFFHFGIALVHTVLCFFWANGKRYHVLRERAIQLELEASKHDLESHLVQSEHHKAELLVQTKKLVETQIRLEQDILVRQQLEQELACQFEALEEYKNILEVQTEKLEKTNAKLELIAESDELTGLLNFRKFRDEFSRQLLEFHRTGQVFSIILADIDHFKSLNDTFGHQAGDEILQRVGVLLRELAGENVSAFRYGGEEFALLLPRTTDSEARQFAELVVRAFEQAEWRHRPITLSAGVATAGGEGGTELLRQADTALYAAKHGGRNRACHVNDLSSAA